MPWIDPNLVAVTDVTCNIVTTLSALTAAIASVKHYYYALAKEAKEIEENIEKELKTKAP